MAFHLGLQEAYGEWRPTIIGAKRSSFDDGIFAWGECPWNSVWGATFWHQSTPVIEGLYEWGRV